MMTRTFLGLMSAMALSYAAVADENTTTKDGDSMKIIVKVGDKALTATLIDSKTAKDLVSLLPLTLTMNDLFGREKFGHLPRPISTDGKRTHTYEVGDIAYWSPGPDVAIYYRHDGEKIPNPGIIVIGKLDPGVEAFHVPGSVEVKITAANEAAENRR
ncbi:MAG: hypothetical protein DMF23_03570 [Verrucomicrobia bacterium]|nr:MAG: hypothetical protein DMF23_03570 [Verrucomicrobiota bacterium]